jgi:hypothetical protein
MWHWLIPSQAYRIDRRKLGRFDRTTMGPTLKQPRYQWLANLDAYRKVPTDLMESSAEGNVLSWFVLVCIMGLLLRETIDFLSPKLVADLSIDSKRSGSDAMMQVDFNITLLDLRCQVG